MQVAILLLGSLFKWCDALLSHRTHLVDLAGSERAGRTKATGDRRGNPKPPSHSQPTLIVSGWRKVQLSTKVYRRWPGACRSWHQDIKLAVNVVANCCCCCWSWWWWWWSLDRYKNGAANPNEFLGTPKKQDSTGRSMDVRSSSMWSAVFVTTCSLELDPQMGSSENLVLLNPIL